MDRESYQNLSRRTQATFASRRSVVYDLFQIYVKQKRESRAYDVADRYVEVEFRSLAVLISPTGPMLFYTRYKLAASLDLVSITCTY